MDFFLVYPDFYQQSVTFLVTNQNKIFPIIQASAH